MFESTKFVVSYIVASYLMAGIVWLVVDLII